MKTLYVGMYLCIITSIVNGRSLNEDSSIAKSFSPYSLSGIKTVGAGGNYSTLSTAFSAINSQGLSGDITLQLLATYSASIEAFPISAPTNTGTFKVLVYPTASGLSVTSANGTGTFNFNHATNITIDGRVNATGPTSDLLIQNTASAGYTLQYINDAIGNVVKHCIIKGSNTSPSTGVIFFSTTTGTNGNDNNLIDSCDIGDAATGTPTNMICSVGSTGTQAQNNSGNTISNSNIYNFYNSTSTTNAGTGINIASGTSDWTISGNSFYQTASRGAFRFPSATNVILLNNPSGKGFVISRNYIGGSAPKATGIPYTINTTDTINFSAISTTVGNAALSSVQGNVIQNISISTPGSSRIVLINLAAGSVNFGDSISNTIGSQTVNNSITIYMGGNYFSGFSAIKTSSAAPAITVVSNNTIGGISLTSPASSNSASTIQGIYITNTGNYTVTGNTIGSATVANSLNISVNTRITGIWSFSSGNTNIRNNIIANILNTSTGNASYIYGIDTQTGTNTISGNILNNFSTACAGSVTTVVGISLISNLPNQIVSHNIIHTLYCSNQSTSAVMRGLDLNGPTSGNNIVEGNLVHSINTASTNPSSDICGIATYNGKFTHINNMIRLGIDANGNAITNGILITGIWKITSEPAKYYHNTVFIGGQNVSANGANTYAFRKTGNAISGTDEMSNNIFENERSNNGSTGGHYSICLINTDATLKNNLYYGTGNGYKLGNIGSTSTTDYPTLQSWKTANPQFDVYSHFANPGLINPTGDTSTLNLHLMMSSPAERMGANIPSILQDFDGETRSSLTPNDIGADAGNYGISGKDVGVIGLINPVLSTCFSNSESIKLTIRNFSTDTINLTANNIRVKLIVSGPYSYLDSVLVTSGILLPGDTLNIDMPGNINMSVNGNYTFTAGTTISTGSADVYPGNDSMTVTRKVLNLTGNYTVGIGGNYVTLTEAMNSYKSATCITGDIHFSLTDNLYPSEILPIGLSNNITQGTKAVIIKPVPGIFPLFSGRFAGPIVEFNGARNIIIDGSNTPGGNSKDITIINTWTGGNAVRFINDASNNSILNCNIEGANTGTIGAVIVLSTGISTGNDSNVIHGNMIRDRIDSAGVPLNLIGSFGTSSAVSNSYNVVSNNILKNFSGSAITMATSKSSDNWTIIANDISQDSIRPSDITGINLVSSAGANFISMNSIHNLGTTGSIGNNFRLNTATGILIGDAQTTTVTRNRLYDFVNDPNSSTDITAIKFNGVSGGTASVTLFNNMVSIVPPVATNQTVIGIQDNGYPGNSFSADYNSIYLGGPGLYTSSFALSRSRGTNYTALNNIAFNDRGGFVDRYACSDGAPNAGNYVSNYNIFIGTGSSQQYFMLFGGSTVNPSIWQTGPPSRDANSLFSTAGVGNFSLAGMFFSSSDLRLVAGSPAIGAASPIAGLPYDYFGHRRNAATPDIGAHELNGTSPLFNFIAGGLWTQPNNWQNMLMPSPMPTEGQININSGPYPCILNLPLYLQGSTSLTVISGSQLIIPGWLMH